MDLSSDFNEEDFFIDEEYFENNHDNFDFIEDYMNSYREYINNYYSNEFYYNEYYDQDSDDNFESELPFYNEIEITNISKFPESDEIEIINEINPNIEIENISIENIRKYKSTFYKDTIKTDIKDTTCLVCYGPFTYNSKIISLKCAHFFHSKCIIPWISRQRTCPTCRRTII